MLLWDKKKRFTSSTNIVDWRMLETLEIIDINDEK